MGSLAIVIPVATGETHWHHLFTDLLMHFAAGEVVWVVANATMKRQITTLTLPPTWRVVCAPRAQRAAQLNCGARATEAAHLWFVHADSRVTAENVALASRAAHDSQKEIHYFRLKFLPDGPRLVVLNAFCANIRSRSFSLPLGDQGLLLPRVIFSELGGFSEALPFAEDFDFMLRAKARKIPVAMLSSTLLTSARTYAVRGWLTTTAFNIQYTMRQQFKFWPRSTSL